MPNDEDPRDLSYEVEDLRCPVIMYHQEDDGETETTERCGTQVAVLLWIGESGHGYGHVSCEQGHDLPEMAHDNALDLDGVPVGA